MKEALLDIEERFPKGSGATFTEVAAYVGKIYANPMLEAIRKDEEESRRRARELPLINEVVAGLNKAAEAQMPIIEELARWREESGRSDYTYRSASTTPKR